jgi:hypothetical protein
MTAGVAFLTTLNRIRDRHPCESGWRKLLAHLGGVVFGVAVACWILGA